MLKNSILPILSILFESVFASIQPFAVNLFVYENRLALAVGN